MNIAQTFSVTLQHVLYLAAFTFDTGSDHEVGAPC